MCYVRIGLVSAIFLLSACASTRPAPPVLASLKGRVLDPRNNPVAGVKVRVAERAVVLTDTDGEFTIRAPASERLAVSFSAPAFMDTTKIYNTHTPSRGNTVIIWPRAAPTPLDAERGGKLTFPAGTIDFPPRALVDERGRTIRGRVSVSFSALDVSDRQQIRSAPGDFTARMRDNSIQRLETFGVFEIFIEDDQRRRANLARGQSAIVELKLPQTPRGRPPGEVGLFSFDRNSGLWTEAGVLQSMPGVQVLSAPLWDLSVTWNADQVLGTSCVQVEIFDCGGAPGIANSHVEAFGVDYSGYSDGYTSTNGLLCLPVKLSATASVIAHHPTATGVQSNPLEIATPANVASASNCGNSTLCPLLVRTHLGYGAFADDLNAPDVTLWHKANGYANSDPNFNVGWRGDHIDFIPSGTDNIMRITLSDQATSTTACSTTTSDCSYRPYASGEYRTNCFYGYGTYKATIKAARGSGLLTTLFTYSEPVHGVPWDEIDIEILGRDPESGECPSAGTYNTIMQTNYFVNGVGNHEHKVCLNLDLTQAHTYEFAWSATAIDWYVDRASNPNPEHTESRVGNNPWPTQPGRMMASLWAGSMNADPWLGTFIYGTPVYADYYSIQYTP
jgi:endo-1,3-1,4-beta-glycanase ExoK